MDTVFTKNVMKTNHANVNFEKWSAFLQNPFIAFEYDTPDDPGYGWNNCGILILMWHVLCNDNVILLLIGLKRKTRAFKILMFWK